MILRHILRHIKSLFNIDKYIEFYEINEHYKEHPAVVEFLAKRTQTLNETYTAQVLY